MLLLCFTAATPAGTYVDDFDIDEGALSGGVVADGVFRLVDGKGVLSLDGIEALDGTLVLRKADQGVLALGLGDASWAADFTAAGSLSLGGQELPLPPGHWTWTTEDEPVLEPSTVQWWESGGVLHCDVHYDEGSSTWFLYYTGVMSPGYGYRQIGLATSRDGELWERYEGNPVLTIDYDTTTVDGIHVHMPTVVVDGGVWHMYYACYQNDIGNRICHATSANGYAWEPRGVVLDLGAPGDFDDANLREPDVQIDGDGTWHMFYQGTSGDEHYGPTGHATSIDGATWTRVGTVSSAKSDLQGGGLVQTPYGPEQWYNCDDAFCYARADHDDWSTWIRDGSVVLAKDWADWNSGYVQAPSPWLLGAQYHTWFNAYSYDTGVEVLAHASSAAAPGEWMTVAFSWDGRALSVSADDGPALTTSLASVDALTLRVTGAVEVDRISLSWTGAQEPGDDTGGGETGGVDTADTGAPTGETGPVDDTDLHGSEPSSAPSSVDGGCGCGASGLASTWWAVLPLVALRRRS